MADGTDKAYCYIKEDESKIVDEHLEFNADEEAEQERLDGSRGPKPTNSLNDFDEEFDEIYNETINKMLDRMERDKEVLSEEIESLGACHKYKPTLHCVNGENMITFNDISLKDCQNKCSNTRGCKGIEYFRTSGASNASDAYNEKDCNLSSSLDVSDCDAGKWQMFLWANVGKMDCKDWRN